MIDYFAAYLAIIFMSVGYANILSTAVYMPVWERQQGLRHVLSINRTSALAYWTAHIGFEFLVSLALIVLTHVILHIMFASPNAYQSNRRITMFTEGILYLTAILALYSFAAICCASLVSFFYSDPQRACSHARYFLAGGNIFLPWIAHLLPAAWLPTILPKLDVALSFSPIYALYYTLSKLLRENFPSLTILLDFVNQTPSKPTYITSSAVGMRCMAIGGVLALVGIAVCEGLSTWIDAKPEQHVASTKRPTIRIDEDAREARTEGRVAVRFADVSKTYSNGFEALRNISMEVGAGSVFGMNLC